MDEILIHVSSEIVFSFLEKKRKRNPVLIFLYCCISGLDALMN